MTRRRPSFVSPSGRFIPHLYRKYKRRRQCEYIVQNLLSLLNCSLMKNVPESECGVLNVNLDYYRSKCDLKNPFCVQHIRSVEAKLKQVVASKIVSPENAKIISDGIINDLKNVFKSRNYRGSLQLYGSYFTGLCCVDSDVDIIFEFRSHDSGTTPKDIPSSIEKILRSFKNKFSKVKLISNTRVPFIRFIHNGTQKECNVTFENKMGIQNSKLIKLYLTMNPFLKALTLYLKQLLNRYEIRGTGRITTHILFWMVVFFLQQKALLPAVVDVRKACPKKYMISFTNCAVPDTYKFRSSRSSASLYSLLLDFAAFYRDFKFLKYIMSPYFGKAYPIEEAENLKSQDYSRRFATSFINLQHPSDLDLNLAKQTKMPTVNKFRILCCHISKVLPHFMKFSKDCNRSLNDILPELLPYTTNQPDELIRCTSIQLNLDTSVRLTGRVIRTVRHLMESVFEFQPTKIVKKNIARTVGEGDYINIPTIYFSYSSTVLTWGNENIKGILPHPELDKYGKPHRKIGVCLVCEIFTHTKTVKVLIESEAHFMNFLDEFARTLFVKIFDVNV